MKLELIKACSPGPFKEYKRQRGGPPQNIFSAAAATPPHIDVVMVDETAGMNADPHTDADLAAIFMSTPDAPRGYELADQYMSQGKTVVFGGLHATFMPDEALGHGDAVILGELEGVWDQVLSDFQAGRLGGKYQAAEPVDLGTVWPYPTHLIPKEQYDGFWSVLVSRGCPCRCSFCLVPPFFGGIRYRPVENVVAEMRDSGASWIELHADNLTANRDYAIELFKAIRPLNVNWVGETTIKMAEDEELLDLAAESGLKYLLVGLETPSKAALRGSGKAFVKPDRIKEDVRKLHEKGIIVDSCVLFGFDEHDTNIFEETLTFVDQVGVDVCQPVIAIPFPGSALFDQLDREGRILTRDRSKYDGTHAVFEPKGMTAMELEVGYEWFYGEYCSLGRSVRRKWRQFQKVGLNAAYVPAW